MRSPPPAWQREPQWGFSGEWCGSMRRSPTATGWKSIARWRSTRRKRAAGAPRAGSSLVAPLRDGLLRARHFGGTLRIVHHHALARRVRGIDARAALDLAHGSLGAFAVGAFHRRFGLRFLRLLLRFLAVLLALLERLLRRQRLLALLRGRGWRGGRRRCGTGRRLERRRLDAARRHVAVAHLAVLVDPFVLLRDGGGRERQCKSHDSECFHGGSNAPDGERMTVAAFDFGVKRHSRIMLLCEKKACGRFTWRCTSTMFYSFTT